MKTILEKRNKGTHHKWRYKRRGSPDYFHCHKRRSRNNNKNKAEKINSCLFCTYCKQVIKIKWPNEDEETKGGNFLKVKKKNAAKKVNKKKRKKNKIKTQIHNLVHFTHYDLIKDKGW